MEGRSFQRPITTLLTPTPLERFLKSSPTEKEPCFSNKVAPKREKTQLIANPNYGLCDPRLHFGAIVGVVPQEILLDESRLCNGFLMGGHDFDGGFVGGNGVEVLGGEKRSIEGEVVKSGGVKSSSCSSSTTASTANIVKGQWTAEEDCLLVKLVNQHGIRKWSHIAKKLVGRIGKQCRERWHNHLRPDIKKDAWSEEEERLLVEAHEKVGNRWAEIAKRIPGRSENSIKNHWNATKRRQNSKRKSKRKAGQGARAQPSILQEYIRSKTSSQSDQLQTTASQPLESSFSTSSPDCTQTMQDFYVNFSEKSIHHFGEERSSYMDNFMQTMQNFYANLDKKAVGDTEEETRTQLDHIQEHCSLDSLDFSGLDDEEDQLVGMEEYLMATQPLPEFFHKEANEPSRGGTNENGDAQLYSDDQYLSYLLNGVPSPSFNAIRSNDLEAREDDDQGFWSCKKDMDLIEMISSSQSSCSQRSNISFT